MNNKPIPLSLRKKSSARVSAVQCLYTMKVTGEQSTPEKLLTNYLDHWQEDHEGGDRAFSKDAEPDKSLLRKLLTASLEHAEDIDMMIRASLNEKWTVERTSPLLLAILTCALVELRFIRTLSAPIIIDEYVTITGRFFEASEMGFVNGLLDKLANPPSAAPAS